MRSVRSTAGCSLKYHACRRTARRSGRRVLLVAAREMPPRPVDVLCTTVCGFLLGPCCFLCGVARFAAVFAAHSNKAPTAASRVSRAPTSCREERFCSLRHGFQRWSTPPHGRPVPLETVAHQKNDDQRQRLPQRFGWGRRPRCESRLPRFTLRQWRRTPS